jgi:hypothetical protein
MVKSYNCLHLDRNYVFQVEVYQDENNEKFFEIGGDKKKYPLDSVKVGQVAKLVSHEGKFKDFDMLELWKVDVDESEINTEKDIKDKGVLLKSQSNFINYFKVEYKPKKEDNISIAVIVTTSTGKCLPMFYLSNKKFAVTNIDLV